jgi:hypothetical protein
VLDWIDRLIEAAVGPVRRLANDVRDRLAAIWGAITGVLVGIAGKVYGLASTVGRLRPGLLRWASETYVTMRWLILQRIPQVAASTLDRATRYAASVVDRLRREAIGWLANLQRWAERAANTLTASLRDFANHITGRVNSIVDTLNRVRNLVFARLTSPERLASWVVGAMWSALWSYANDNAARYGRALWRRRRAIEGAVVTWLDEMIARVL